MAESIEPERSDPSGWLLWVGVLGGLLVFGLVWTVATTAGDRVVSLPWVLAGIGALLMAGLVLPAWAIFGLEN